MKKKNPNRCFVPVRLLVTGLMLIFSVPTNAGWNETEWNMTPEQVLDAMVGNAPNSRDGKSDKPDGKKIDKNGKYKIGGSKLRAAYHYDGNGLSRVSFKAKARNCKAIIQSLLDQHGKPIRISDQLILKLVIWHDKTNQNRIRLMVSTGICSLNYERLSDYETHDLDSTN